MKLLILATCFTMSAIHMFGQKVSNLSTEEAKVAQYQRVIMYKGYIWKRDEGGSVIVSDEVTVSGMTVMADGKVILPDNTTTFLREGEFIEDGKIYRTDDEDVAEPE